MISKLSCRRDDFVIPTAGEFFCTSESRQHRVFGDAIRAKNEFICQTVHFVKWGEKVSYERNLRTLETALKKYHFYEKPFRPWKRQVFLNVFCRKLARIVEPRVEAVKRDALVETWQRDFRSFERRARQFIHTWAPQCNLVLLAYQTRNLRS